MRNEEIAKKNTTRCVACGRSVFFYYFEASWSKIGSGSLSMDPSCTSLFSAEFRSHVADVEHEVREEVPQLAALDERDGDGLEARAGGEGLLFGKGKVAPSPCATYHQQPPCTTACTSSIALQP
jgi:hypothetical protein